MVTFACVNAKRWLAISHELRLLFNILLISAAVDTWYGFTKRSKEASGHESDDDHQGPFPK